MLLMIGERVHTFEDFERNAMMLRDDKFSCRKIRTRKKKLCKCSSSEEEYYKEFERRMKMYLKK